MVGLASSPSRRERLVVFKLGAYPLSLRQLQYVTAVAEYRNFRVAASKCFVSQPSLSTQVADLESTLGVQIFERDPKGVMITEAGEDIVKAARRVLTDTEELLRAAQRHVDPATMHIKIGVIPTLAPYLLPDLGPEWEKLFPELRVTWIEEKTSVLVKLVESGELDVALLASEADTGNLNLTPIVTDAFVLAASPHSTLGAVVEPVAVDALRDSTVLLLNEGHCFRDQALDLCQSAGATPDRVQATSLTTLVQMASSSHGATLVPKLAVPVENRRAQVVIREFVDPPPFRTIAFAERRRSPLKDLVEKLIPAVQLAYERVTSS
ncbi:MAG: LysR substrate-binding domain-containing protein [Myxococcota bacterium]